MKKPAGSYPHVRVREDGRAVVSQAGSVLLIETVRKTRLDQAISAVLAPWRKPRAVHGPGKILVDFAPSVTLSGDCLADIALLRSEPAVFGPVASDPTVSRLIGTLATSGEKALTAIRAARSEVRNHVWELAGDQAPDSSGQVIVDLDGVLIVAHSDKQDAAPTWQKSYGHHPLMGFVDHGPGGTGEPVAALLRPGNAGSNTAADHITAARLALAQLPKKYRRGRRTLIRCDSGGDTHEFVAWLAQHLLRHQHPRPADRRPRAPSPAAGPRGGPRPGRTFDRPAQLAPARSQTPSNGSHSCRTPDDQPTRLPLREEDPQMARRTSR